MRTLALTGGIATGKSTFARLFLSLVPDTVFFDCDAAVQELLAEPKVIASIAAALGADLIGPGGSLNRARSSMPRSAGNNWKAFCTRWCAVPVLKRAAALPRPLPVFLPTSRCSTNPVFRSTAIWTLWWPAIPRVSGRD